MLYAGNLDNKREFDSMRAVSQIALDVCRGVMLATAMGCGAAFAQATGSTAVGYSIHQHALPNLPNTLLPTWGLSVTGQWPTQCPPTLQSVSLDGTNLRVDARAVLGLCEKRAMPFSIELNPALALNRTALAPGIYQVRFYAADGAQAAPKLRAFTLIDRSIPNTPKIVPETGFWWSSNNGGPSADRTVASIELQGNQLSVALMSYDESGRPLWFFGAAPFDGHIAHLTLLRLSGGSSPFSAVSDKPHGEPALTLDLEFSSNAHAQAWLSRPVGDGSLQLQNLDLVRLALVDANDGRAWQGDWVLVSDAENSPPQRLSLDNFRLLDSSHFSIQSDDGASALTCAMNPAQSEWPPGSCTLDMTAPAASVTFQSVAIDRMDGTDDGGAAVHLLRISR